MAFALLLPRLLATCCMPMLCFLFVDRREGLSQLDGMVEYNDAQSGEFDARVVGQAIEASIAIKLI
jgi:hypothetical protein